MGIEELYGPLGLLVALVFAVTALALGRFVVPRFVLDKAEERARKLEEENSALNKAVIRLTEETGGLRTSVKLLEWQAEELKRELRDLQHKLGVRV